MGQECLDRKCFSGSIPSEGFQSSFSWWLQEVYHLSLTGQTLIVSLANTPSEGFLLILPWWLQEVCHLSLTGRILTVSPARIPFGGFLSTLLWWLQEACHRSLNWSHQNSESMSHCFQADGHRKKIKHKNKQLVHSLPRLGIVYILLISPECFKR